jgi:hypothetical protein
MISRGWLLGLVGIALGSVFFAIQASTAVGWVATADWVVTAIGLILIALAIFVLASTYRRSVRKTIYLSAPRDLVSDWAEEALQELPQGPAKIYRGRHLLDIGVLGTRAGDKSDSHDRHAITLVLRSSRTGTKVHLESLHGGRAGGDMAKDREYVEALAATLVDMDQFKRGDPGERL